MTYHSSISRRGFLQSTAIGAAPLSVASRPEENPEPDDIPDADLIEDYLGVTALSYDDPRGELWYRTAVENPEGLTDCVYRIGQTIIAQDSDMAADANLEEPVVVDARFELQLTASDAEGLPAFYREFESGVGSSATESDDDTISTSQLSIGAYPGILTHYEETAGVDPLDELEVIWYVQTFPWGLLYWDIIYDATATVELRVDAHQELLRKRKRRDWDVPSLAAKPHWEAVHHGDQSEKGRYRGDISPILDATPGFEQMALERVDEQRWTTSSAAQSAVVALNTYR